MPDATHAAPLGAFPSDFPSDAVAKLTQAFLGGKLTPDVAEPIYDLVGYFLGRVFGSSEPAPRPKLSASPESLAAAEEIGRACEDYASAFRALMGDDARGEVDLEAIPWGLLIPLAARIIKILLDLKASSHKAA